MFATDKSNKIFQKQWSILETHKDACKERDLEIIPVFDKSENSNLFSKYEIKNGKYTLILIGKDKSEKLRAEQVVTIEQLFSLIDAMPMRQIEMKRKINHK